MTKYEPTPQWQRYGLIGLVAVIIILALRGLMTDYLPDIHDITPLIWSRAFFEGTQSGWLYPIWLPQIWYGFGLPVFQFYAPLYYWITALFQSLGLDVLYATKAVLALSLIGGWWFMYLWAREFLGRPASILSASLFIWTPYYLSLIYLRGAFPEFFALSLLPLLFWAVTKLIKQKNLFYFIISTIVWVLIFLSHTLTSGIAMGLMLFYVSYLHFFEKDLRIKPGPVIGSLALAVLLTAFHWLPAVVSSGSINTDVLISDDFAYFNNFLGLKELVSLWPSVDWRWKTLGIIQITIITLAVISYKEILDRTFSRRILALGILILILLGMTIPASDFVWNNLPLIKYLQFPSRWLGPIALLTALLAGTLLEALISKDKSRHLAMIGVMLAAVVVYWPHAYSGPNRFEQEKDLKATDLNIYDYLDKTLFSAHAQEKSNMFFDRGVFSFEYLPRDLLIEEARVLAGHTLTEANERYLAGESPRFTKIQTEDKYITIEILEEGFVNFAYKITAEGAGRIRINQFEFPTWEILLDGQPVKTVIKLKDLGQFLDIPAGTHTLILKFKHLPITIWSRMFSGIIFLLTIIGLILAKVRYIAGAKNKNG